jgi:hypothetical protein
MYGMKDGDGEIVGFGSAEVKENVKKNAWPVESFNVFGRVWVMTSGWAVYWRYWLPQICIQEFP